MDCSTPGSPVLHYLPESAQIHVHWVSDAIQPSHPLSSPSHFAFNLSQNQGLFQWVSSSHQVAKVLELASASVLSMTIWDWFPLGLTGSISLQSKGLSRVFSNTTFQKHHWLYGSLSAKWCLCFLIQSSFPSKKQVSFNFMATVTVCSDFGAHENKSWKVSLRGPSFRFGTEIPQGWHRGSYSSHTGTKLKTHHSVREMSYGSLINPQDVWKSIHPWEIKETRYTWN